MNTLLSNYNLTSSSLTKSQLSLSEDSFRSKPFQLCPSQLRLQGKGLPSLQLIPPAYPPSISALLSALHYTGPAVPPFHKTFKVDKGPMWSWEGGLLAAALQSARGRR